MPEARPGIKGDKTRLNNGAIYEVDGFTASGDIRLANGFVVPKDYGGLAHGYVVTSHASQGKTVDQVLIALGSESLAAASREQFYVSVSRGREGVKLYTDDKAAMMEAVQASCARLSATELMRGVPLESRAKRADAGSNAAVRRANDRRRLRNAAHELVQAVDRYRQRQGMDYGRG